MTEQFFTYTDKFVNFTQVDKELLDSVLTFRIAKTKTELVSYDKRTDELFFLLKGCLRKYYVKDGEQITVYIMAENSFIGAFDSCVAGTPSKETIETFEPTELLVLTKKDLTRLYKEIPLMNEFV
ncbi:MAG TPA: cyclic nucleotide-binding domain-containing protein [Saprospiraceae bacterium]|nr:cyclic nucleotide-binding domain-containing protein [Saprospiraceae bacterium]